MSKRTNQPGRTRRRKLGFLSRMSKGKRKPGQRVGSVIANRRKAGRKRLAVSAKRVK
ncbi:50S ribosomal protein L34 [candidate division WWE3 bacterium]|nr:50S ribosomal protein L34 [candidate division WWE3 bacterium]